MSNRNAEQGEPRQRESIANAPRWVESMRRVTEEDLSWEYYANEITAMADIIEDQHSRLAAAEKLAEDAAALLDLIYRARIHAPDDVFLWSDPLSDREGAVKRSIAAFKRSASQSEASGKPNG